MIRMLDSAVGRNAEKIEAQCAGLDDFADVNVNLRKEVFAMRDKLEGITKDIAKHVLKLVSDQLQGATGPPSEARQFKAPMMATRAAQAAAGA